MQVRRALLGAAGLLLGMALGVSADTLQMKNGDVVRGKYLGGSERAVQFEVNGNVELYNTSEIVSITFTGMPTASRASTPAVRESAPPRESAVSRQPAATSSRSGAGLTVPAGTHLMARMIDGVDSETNHVGDRFRASLESDLLVGDVVVAPRGTEIYGRLAEAQEAGRISGKALLRLELTDIMINNRMHPIMTSDYEAAGEGRGTDTAKKAAVGAVVGTIIGAVAGGGKGAAIGAGVGAGAGTGVNIATKGERVRVPSETLLDFRLEEPFTVRD